MLHKNINKLLETIPRMITLRKSEKKAGADQTRVDTLFPIKIEGISGRTKVICNISPHWNTSRVSPAGNNVDQHLRPNYPTILNSVLGHRPDPHQKCHVWPIVSSILLAYHVWRCTACSVTNSADNPGHRLNNAALFNTLQKTLAYDKTLTLLHALPLYELLFALNMLLVKTLAEL